MSFSKGIVVALVFPQLLYVVIQLPSELQVDQTNPLMSMMLLLSGIDPGQGFNVKRYRRNTGLLHEMP